MIRQAFLRDLNEVFAKTNYFSEHDFTITSKDRNDGTSLVITYRYDVQYSIVAVIADVIQPDQKDFEISGRATPGDMDLTEHFVLAGKSKFLAYIAVWLKRLRSELEAIPSNRQIDEQRKQIDSILTQFGDLKNEYFSNDEAESLKNRLDELEQRMAQQITDHAKNSEVAEKRVSELEKEFEVLKQSVDILKKPGWLSAFVSRVARWAKDPDNRALLKDGTQIVKGLLE